MSWKDWIDPSKWGASSKDEGPSASSEGGQPDIHDDRKMDAFHSFGGVRNVRGSIYDGEKNAAELGPAKDYMVDHYTLRARSYQYFLDNDITRTVINSFIEWVIGQGLRLQATPMDSILQDEGIGFSDERSARFKQQVDQRFKLWGGSRRASYNRMKTFHMMEADILKNALLGGDVLVVVRVKDGIPNIQLIDGSHVRTPLGRRTRDNVSYGVEFDNKGRHVAYHVQTGWRRGDSQRIPAIGRNTGMTFAYLVYGAEYRIDTQRGIPLISTVMETLGKMDRYKEATVTSAEERAKVAYAIEHETEGTGENPFQKSLAKARNQDDQSEKDMPTDHAGNQLAENVAATMPGEAYNLPPGSEMKQVASSNELNFQSFFTTLAEGICAAVGIPPEVAFSKFTNNFSSSRAAIKQWEHTIKVWRKYYSEQHHGRAYPVWLHHQILEGKVEAPGYLTAFQNKNEDVLEAYRSFRVEGESVPHIDPVKEVNAERAKLGEQFKGVPLTDLDKATESVNAGEADANIQKAAEQLRQARDLGFVGEEESEPSPSGDDDDPSDAE